VPERSKLYRADNAAGKKKTEQEGIEDLKKEIIMVGHFSYSFYLCISILSIG